jgi:hypothetical protein
MSGLLTAGILQQARNLATKKQYALSFDGVNDYVRIPRILDPKRFDIQLSLNGISTPRYFVGTDVQIGGIRYNGTSLAFYHNTGTFYILTYTHSVPSPILSFRFESGFWSFYENDILKASNFSSIRSFAIGYIGKREDGYFYPGQVQSFFATDNNDEFIADYDFTNPDPNTLFDKSPNANHGTIYGAQWIELP